MIDMKYKKIIAVGMVSVYAILATVMCVPMAIATHEGLSIIGVESELVCLDTGKDSYGHCAIQINDVVYELRYLGMYRQSNINYDVPIYVYQTSDELIEEYHFLPPINLLIKAIPEMV